MEAYFQAFVNFEQNNCAKLLSMAEFAYNNFKNASTGRMPFELNYGYYLHIFFKEYTKSYFYLKSSDELLAKLWDLITVCWKNLYHA